MKITSDNFLGIGVGIIFGGILFVFYLASLFGSNLPGFTLLIPIFLGGGFIMYSLKLPEEIQNKPEVNHE